MFFDTYEKYDGGESVVVLGKFDGVHIGHKKLFDIAKKVSGGRNIIAFTFYTDKAGLTTSLEKRELLRAAGADVVIEQTADKGFFDMSAGDFMTNVLVSHLKVKAIVCGKDFCFGKNRGGDVSFLKKYADKYAYDIYVAEDKKYCGQIVKSSLIRDYLAKGDMDVVKGMLGYEYYAFGEVVHGNRLGRKYNFPTANIWAPSGKLMPPHGVYASKVIIDNKIFYGMTNIGIKPTINDLGLVNIETNIFDFDEDIYGKNVEVHFIKYFRTEKMFSDVDELFVQIAKDLKNVKEYFDLI